MDWPTATAVIVVSVVVGYLILFVTRTLERVAVHKATVEADASIKKSVKMAKVRRQATSKRDNDDDDDDLPPWVHGIARGMGIDLEKVADQDPAELRKVAKAAEGLAAKRESGGGGGSDDYL